MRSSRLMFVAAVCAMGTACTAAKEQQPEAAPPQTATTTDSMPMVKADSTRCGATTDSTKCVATVDSARRAAAAKAKAAELRDSAIGPKFVLDSNGRPVPIKKRP